MRRAHSTLMARFADDAALVRAIRATSRRGARLEAATPFDSDEVLEALGESKSRIPWLAFGAAAGSGTGAWAVLWWTRTVSFPLDVGARPNASSWADLPIIFESVVLGAALVAFFAFFVASGLPRLRHPWFGVPGFGDSPGWWLAVEVDDSDALDVEKRLESLGALSIHALASDAAGEESEAE
jgi:hypothetical protein